MRKLTLTNHVQSDTTVLENEFIDHYMAEANGEYVKVYLILLRHLNEPSGTLTISKIADLLDITEKDVIRALNYWKKKGLLDYDMPVDGETPAIPAQPRMHRNRLLLLFSRHRQLQMYPVLSSTALVKSSKNFFLLQSSTLARRCPILT